MLQMWIVDLLTFSLSFLWRFPNLVHVDASQLYLITLACVVETDSRRGVTIVGDH